MRLEEFENIVRQQSESAQFDFNEADWKGARDLIKQPRRRRMAWLLLILPVGLAGWILMQGENSVDESLENVLLSEKLEKATSQQSPTTERIQEVKTSETVSSTVDNPVLHESTTKRKIQGRQLVNAESSDLSEATKPTQNLGDEELSPTQNEASIPGINLSREIVPLLHPIESGILKLDTDQTHLSRSTSPSIIKFKKWEVYCHGGYNHAVGNTSSQNQFKLGVGVLRQFGNGMYFGLSPSAILSQGYSGFSKIEKQVQYGVEISESFYGIFPKSVLSLDVPIHLGVNIKSWRIDGAYHFNFLIGGTGKIYKMASTDKGFIRTEFIGRGSLDRRHSDAFTHGPAVGVYRRFGYSHELGLTGFHYTTGFFANDDFAQNTQGFSGIGLRYNYYFL